MKLNKILLSVLLIQGITFGGYVMNVSYNNQNPRIIEVSSNARVIDEVAYLDLNSVSDKTYMTFKKDLQMVAELGVKTIHMDMHNPGGRVTIMWAMYDYMDSIRSQYGLRYIATARGIVASAAIPLFLMCDVRYATANTYFMVHPHSGAIENTQASASYNKMCKEWTKRYTDILVKFTKLTTEKSMELLSDDHRYKSCFMNVEEAYELGFIDGVI